MKTITVKFTQQLTFEQEIQVTEEEYQTLQNSGDRIKQPMSWSTDDPIPAYDIITTKIDFSSPVEEDAIEDFEIIE